MYKLSCFLIILFLFSCKIHPDSSRRYDDNNPNKVYKLRLNPAVGSQYAYTISRSTEYQLEVDGKKVENKNRSTVGITYTIGRDSAGDVLLNMVYDKIHLYTKNGETETEMDADHGGESGDPVERALALLKGVSIQAVVSPVGELKALNGYDAIKEKVLTVFNVGSADLKAIASKQWDERIKGGLIKSNMQQFFRIFPDSAVHIGDRWKLSSTQNDQVTLTTTDSYLLKGIEDGTAIIRAEGKVTADHAAGAMNGYSYNTNLKGDQEGEFDMESSSGMLLKGDIESKVEGTMTVLGRDIPVTITMTMKMEGKRL